MNNGTNAKFMNIKTPYIGQDIPNNMPDKRLKYMFLLNITLIKFTM